MNQIPILILSDYDYFMENIDVQNQAAAFLKEKYKYLHSKMSRQVVAEGNKFTTESMDIDHALENIPATSLQRAPESARNSLLPTLQEPPKVGKKYITLSETEVKCLKYAIHAWNNMGSNKSKRFNWECISNLYRNKCRIDKADNNAVVVYYREATNLKNYYKDNLFQDKEFCSSLNRSS